MKEIIIIIIKASWFPILLMILAKNILKMLVSVMDSKTPRGIEYWASAVCLYNLYVLCHYRGISQRARIVEIKKSQWNILKFTILSYNPRHLIGCNKKAERVKQFIEYKNYLDIPVEKMVKLGQDYDTILRLFYMQSIVLNYDINIDEERLKKD